MYRRLEGFFVLNAVLSDGVLFSCWKREDGFI